MRRFDLRSLRFGADDEAWRRLPVEVDPFVFGGAEYGVRGGAVDLDLSVGRVGDRYTLSAAFHADLQGPCQRCLEDADVALDVRGLQVVARGESMGGEDDEAYATGYILDAGRWVRDLIGASLPEQLLCGPECRGLCPQCGANLNATPPGHTHDGG